MNKKLSNTIKYLLFVSIGIVLMYLAFRGVDFAKMWNDLSAANYWYVLVSLVGAMLAFFSRAYRWVILIEPLGQKPKLSNSFYSLLVGYFANMAVPRIGEITRCTALYEVERTPITSSFGTVVVERIVDLITLFTLLLVTMLWKFEEISTFVSDKIFSPMGSKISAAGNSTRFLLVAGGSVLGILLLAFLLRRKITGSGFFKKTKSLWQELVEGLKTVFNLKRKGAFLFHSVLIWALYFFNTWICFFAIPETSSLSAMTGLFVLVVGGFGMSAPSPGGFGTFHILVASSLTLTGITGTAISYDDGLLFATIVHSSQVLLVLVVGTFSLIMLNIAKRKAMQNESPGNHKK